MADKDTDKAAEQALQQGYIGEVPDEIENDAYTVQGQGEDTARREREQVRRLRTDAYDRSGEEAPSTSGRARRKPSSSSSSSGGSSGS